MPNLPQTFDAPRGELTIEGLLRSLARQWSLLIQTVNAAVGLTGSTLTKTASYTMNGNDAILLVNASSASVVILVDQGTQYVGRVRAVKKMDSTANPVTVIPTSGNIEGLATRVLSTQYKAITFVSDGTDLWLLNTL